MALIDSLDLSNIDATLAQSSPGDVSALWQQALDARIMLPNGNPRWGVLTDMLDNHIIPVSQADQGIDVVAYRAQALAQSGETNSYLPLSPSVLAIVNATLANKNIQASNPAAISVAATAAIQAQQLAAALAQQQAAAIQAQQLAAALAQQQAAQSNQFGVPAAGGSAGAVPTDAPSGASVQPAAMVTGTMPVQSPGSALVVDQAMPTVSASFPSVSASFPSVSASFPSSVSGLGNLPPAVWIAGALALALMVK